MITVQKTSMLSGRERTMTLDITVEQLKEWEAGALIQDVMPNLSANEREFLMTGATPEEWDTLMAVEEE